MIDAQTIRRHSPCTVDTRLRGDGKSLICFLCVLFMPFKLLFIIELIANFIRHFYLTKKNIFYFLIFVCFLLFVFLQFRFYSCWTICCFCFIAFHFSIQSLCTLHTLFVIFLLYILSLGSKKNRLS